VSEGTWPCETPATACKSDVPNPTVAINWMIRSRVKALLNFRRAILFEKNKKVVIK